MGNKLNYSFLEKVKKMPPLKHTVDDLKFDIEKSEVAKYIMSIPEVKQKIFEMAKVKKLIIFDDKTKTWKGIDFK